MVADASHDLINVQVRVGLDLPGAATAGAITGYRTHAAAAPNIIAKTKIKKLNMIVFNTHSNRIKNRKVDTRAHHGTLGPPAVFEDLFLEDPWDTDVRVKVDIGSCIPACGVYQGSIISKTNLALGQDESIHIGVSA